MDPWRLTAAFGPLCFYLLLLGWINLRRRPLVVSGSWDLAALGCAVSGLILVGPVELFMPRIIALRFGAHQWLYWLLLSGLYFMLLALAVLSSRPRITVYNVSDAELLELLDQVALEVDSGARWAGMSLCLPQVHVQLQVERLSVWRCVQLVPLGDVQSYQAWQRLRIALRQGLNRLEVAGNPAGTLFLSGGVVLLLALLLTWLGTAEKLAHALSDLLGR